MSEINNVLISRLFDSTVVGCNKFAAQAKSTFISAKFLTMRRLLLNQIVDVCECYPEYVVDGQGSENWGEIK